MWQWEGRIYSTVSLRCWWRCRSPDPRQETWCVRVLCPFCRQCRGGGSRLAMNNAHGRSTEQPLGSVAAYCVACACAEVLRETLPVPRGVPTPTKQYFYRPSMGWEASEISDAQLPAGRARTAKQQALSCCATHILCLHRRPLRRSTFGGVKHSPPLAMLRETRSAILLCCAVCALLQRETLRRRCSSHEQAFCHPFPGPSTAACFFFPTSDTCHHFHPTFLLRIVPGGPFFAFTFFTFFTRQKLRKHIMR